MHLTKQQKRDIRALRWMEFKESIFNIKRIIWNRTIKRKWYKLWIREDEFHKSLDLDMNAMLVMTHEQLEEYYAEIGRRRKIAHDRDFKEEIDEVRKEWGLDK